MTVFGRQLPYEDVDASVVLVHYFEEKKMYEPEFSIDDLIKEIKRSIYNLTEYYHDYSLDLD